MAKTIEYFFDYVSPYSYLADGQVAGLVARTGAEIVHRPMLLGGVMKATGNSPPATVPAKGAYMMTDIARWVARYGLEFSMNPHFPVNTVGVMRAALATLEDGGFPAFHQAAFRAMWREGVNLADEDALRGVADGAGLDGTKVVARSKEQAIKDQLRKNTEEAVARGAFGAPTFFVGDEMFWGNDRLEFLEAAVRR